LDQGQNISTTKLIWQDVSQLRKLIIKIELTT